MSVIETIYAIDTIKIFEKMNFTIDVEHNEEKQAVCMHANRGENLSYCLLFDCEYLEYVECKKNNQVEHDIYIDFLEDLVAHIEQNLQQI